MPRVLVTHSKHRVLVTRSQPGAEETAKRLRDLGFEPILAPLRTLEAVAHDPALVEAGVDALAFTSAAGVRFWTGRRDLPAFCVGDATAEAARAAGHTDVRSAAKDGAALAVLIVENTRQGATIVHVRGDEVAVDLASALAAVGRRGGVIIVYRAIDAVSLPPGALDDPHAVLFHSPAGARIFTRLTAHSGALRSVRAVALSAAVAQMLDPGAWGSIEVAEEPTEIALLATLTAAKG